MLNTLALIVAIVLSIAAGTISVIGLAAIFSGAFYAVIVVASILEIAKVVTAAWLHTKWQAIQIQLKVYLSVAVAVLMLITSLGVYGFFARAHIDQQISIQTGESSRIPLVSMKIEQEKQNLDDVQRQISQIDNAVAAMTEKGKATRDAKAALTEAQRQRQTRQQLVTQRQQIVEKIAALQLEKSQLENSVKKHEAEVGPLKYLANTIYGNANSDQLEHAVRLLILTLVFVFDPLAIALIIAASHKTATSVPKLAVVQSPTVAAKKPRLVARKSGRKRTSTPDNGKKVRMRIKLPYGRSAKAVLDLSKVRL